MPESAAEHYRSRFLEVLEYIDTHHEQRLCVEQLSERAGALLLPDGPGVQALLYVRDGDQLHRRAVKLGRRAVGQVEVLSGLHAGEEVLISQPPSDAERLRLP